DSVECRDASAIGCRRVVRIGELVQEKAAEDFVIVAFVIDLRRPLVAVIKLVLRKQACRPIDGAKRRQVGVGEERLAKRARGGNAVSALQAGCIERFTLAAIRGNVGCQAVGIRGYRSGKILVKQRRDGVGQGSHDQIPELRSLHQQRLADRSSSSLAFIGTEEEEPVSFDRTANRASKLVHPESWPVSIEKLASVEFVVAEKLISIPMEVIRPRLRYHRRHGADRGAVLSG